MFVPGNRPERFDKAAASGADCVILDLEDAVSVQDKDSARASVAAYLEQDRHAVCLRVNGVGTPWFEDDLALCTLPGVSSVMLPKAESLDAVNHVTGRLAGNIPVLPFIESAHGYTNMREIADAHQVQRLVFGVLDFILDLGVEAQGDEINSVRLQMTLTSRLAEIAAPVEGVFQDIKDLASLQEDTMRARRLGFGARLCVHPDQVAVVNACFQFTDAEIDWARRVIAAADASRGGVIAVDGKMVDRPVIEKARRILK